MYKLISRTKQSGYYFFNPLGFAPSIVFGSAGYCPLDTTGMFDFDVDPTATNNTCGYCPLDTTGMFDVDFTITPTNNTCGYCPLDTTGMFDFDVNTTISEDNCGYCPQDNTGFDSINSLTHLLLNFNGANGATTTTDGSNYAQPIAFISTAQLSTAQSKFGGSSLLLNGSSDYITATVAQMAQYHEHAGWTIECWFYPTSAPTLTAVLSVGNGNGSGTFKLAFNSSPVLDSIYVVNPDNGGQFITSAAGVAINTWHHVAVTCNADSQYEMFLNGISEGTGTASNIYTPNANNILRIGAGTNNTEFFPGHIEDVRMSREVIYTTNFTPPTAELTIV